MPIFEKVLYSTDFSPLAKVALNYVKSLKGAGAKEAAVVHVPVLSVELPGGTDLLGEKNLYNLLPEADREYVLNAVKKLEDIGKELEEAGFKVKLYMRAGNIPEQIVSIAQDEDVKLIVMGAHGRSLLAEIFIGSVSADVIRQARCPVLVVKKG